MDTSVQSKVESFFKKYPLKSFSPGKIIIMPEKAPKGVYFLKDGIVRVFSLSKDGIELTLNIFKPFSFFPMQWVMNNKQDRYYYETLTEVIAYCVPREDFQSFIQREHDVSYDLLKRIYRGLDGYLMKMESLLSGGAYLRTLTIILIHALRFGTRENKKIALHLTHLQIAKEAGMSRETVTREIKKLAHKGLVSYKKETLFVPDILKLEQEILE